VAKQVDDDKFNSIAISRLLVIACNIILHSILGILCIR